MVISKHIVLLSTIAFLISTLSAESSSLFDGAACMFTVYRPGIAFACPNAIDSNALNMMTTTEEPTCSTPVC